MRRRRRGSERERGRGRRWNELSGSSLTFLFSLFCPPSSCSCSVLVFWKGGSLQSSAFSLWPDPFHSVPRSVPLFAISNVSITFFFSFFLFFLFLFLSSSDVSRSDSEFTVSIWDRGTTNEEFLGSVSVRPARLDGVMLLISYLFFFFWNCFRNSPI